MDFSKAATGILVLLLVLSIFGALNFSSQASRLEQNMEALNASFTQQLTQSQANYASLQAKYSLSQQELESAQASLASEKTKLAIAQAQLAEAERQLAESKASLESQRQQVSQIAANLSSLETSINDSMSWFRDNAYMPKNYSWAGDIFMKRVASDCTERGNLNLACISHLMENTAFAIHYRTDTVSSGKEDFLQSVKQTINSGWGDCEDYSLIFKAILNSMRLENSSLTAIAWQPSASGEFRVYPKESSDSTNEPYWVYSNAKAAPMGSLSHPYVICYTVDPSSGHCVVALSSIAIEGSSQVAELTGAHVFEPQNGRYLGRIGESFGICTQPGCSQMAGGIWMVISDSDLYIYGDDGWQGYADSLSQVRQERASLPI